MKKSKQTFAVIILMALFSILSYAQPSYVPLTTNGVQVETAITADPSNSNHLMAGWNDWYSGFSHSGCSFSIDGGNSWTTPSDITDLGDAVNGVDPSCAIKLRTGVEYYTYLRNSNRIYIARSTNDGGDWSTQYVSQQLTGQDKPYMTIDNTFGKQYSNPGRIYVTWSDYSHNNDDQIYFAYSDDGFNWTQHILADVNDSPVPRTQMIPLTGSGPRVQSAIPAVGPDGTVYVVYLYISDNQTISSSRIDFRYSTNGGQSFYVHDPVADNFQGICDFIPLPGLGYLRPHSFPSIAIDQNSGNLYVAWMQQDNGTTLDIYCASSTDKGNNWSQTLAAAGGSGNALLPWLTVNSSGVVSLSYYLENSSHLVDVYVAQSYNNGQSFGSVTRITPSSENPNNATQDCDYMGAVSLANGRTLPLWTDLSSGSHIRTTPYYYAGGNTSQSLTIPYGQTAVFAPGAVTKFTNGSSLIVNGTLNAVGTPSNHITFDFTSPSNQTGITYTYYDGSLQYCDIKNSMDGIWGNGALPNTISNCTFTNCTEGIYVSNVSGTTTISHCTFQNNSSYGIILYNSSPWISYCTISSNHQDGINCYYYSSPYIWNSTISGNSYNGIRCNFYSSAHLANPTIGAVDYGYNTVINNNSIGVYASNHSNVFLGAYQGGYNSIHNNASYEVSAEYSSVIPAQYNYWARPAPNYYDWSDFSTFVGSSIDPTHALPSSPTGAMPLVSNNSNLSQDPSESNTQNTADISFLDSELLTAASNLVLCNYDKAILEYMQRLNKETAKDKIEYIITQLAECYRSSGKEGFIDFLNQNVRRNLSKSDDLYWLTLDLENGSLMKQKSYSKVLDNLNLIKSLVSNDKDAYKLVLFNLGCFYYNVMNDISNTKKYLLELESKYPDDDLIAEAKLMLGINDINSLSKGTLGKNNFAEKELEKSASYSLEQNYPNPFNPSTQINYSIKENGFVTLRVYDIVGKEIATLVNEDKEAGTYSVSFSAKGGSAFGGNASNLASGIYFYQLKSGNFISTKKMLLIK